MKEDPIQNMDKIDIVAEKKDGSVDLIIVVSDFLDDSEYHENLLRQKIQSYVDEIVSDEWESKYGKGNSTIYVKAVIMPHQEIINLIGAIKKYLADYHIGLWLEIA